MTQTLASLALSGAVVLAWFLAVSAVGTAILYVALVTIPAVQDTLARRRRARITALRRRHDD